jgi:hypothetical protein
LDLDDGLGLLEATQQPSILGPQPGILRRQWMEVRLAPALLRGQRLQRAFVSLPTPRREM